MYCSVACTDVCWPDPDDMVAQLRGLGVKQVFVSVHPFNEPGSTTYNAMVDQGLCVRFPNGTAHPWNAWRLPTCSATNHNSMLTGADADTDADTDPHSLASCLYDPSNLVSSQNTSTHTHTRTCLHTDACTHARIGVGRTHAHTSSSSNNTPLPSMPTKQKLLSHPDSTLSSLFTSIAPKNLP